MPKIVLAGQDVPLLETRAEVLKKIDAEVVYCIGSDALKVVTAEMPDLLVLCHSLGTEEAESIAAATRACCPKTKILLVVSQVTTGMPDWAEKFDAVSQPEPARLLVRATKLLSNLPFPQGRDVFDDGPRPATV